MHLLVRPPPFADESLESYFLRLSQENGFERYSVFSGSLKAWLLTTDHAAAGAFPLELSRLNLFHASRSSGLRVRALQLVERLIAPSPARLQQLALLHSDSCFGQGLKAVYRAGIEIPLCFIRTRHIPCCPACLRESGYVRQCWHYLPYMACHRHGGRLIDACPACGAALDYMVSESMTHCRCGFDLRAAQTSPAPSELITLAALACGTTFEGVSHPLLTTEPIGGRFGALLWFQLRYLARDTGGGGDTKLTSALSFFDAWPENFLAELRQRVEEAQLRQTRLLNHTPFADVFGDLLVDCRQLPMRQTGQNFILRFLLAFLTDLVAAHPKSKVANMGDLLLSTLEVAALLSTSVWQVRRLQQEGFLPLAIRPASRGGCTPSQPVFRLRQVIEFRLARMPSQLDEPLIYLAAR